MSTQLDQVESKLEQRRRLRAEIQERQAVLDELQAGTFNADVRAAMEDLPQGEVWAIGPVAILRQSANQFRAFPLYAVNGKRDARALAIAVVEFLAEEGLLQGNPAALRAALRDP